ncbi:toxin-antitoxin system YwqK family antitoxin [Olleya sp. HaHaR_3_96]|uniref:toxin-antitoxin system YwqK family antitoxin n=1 Tax=Olleya sp. HaHaR_3_96 TaxID=2745560 RepID=UPI001C4E9727|nr:hypothetical protein [Olleya sp. HaHaR_3_96]QXP59449.1 hypothetical protein H0I26_16255 [Olleya sp. HaHaR_3_96]
MKTKLILFVALLISTTAIKAQRTTTKEINHPIYGKATVETSFDQNDHIAQQATFTKDTLLTNGKIEIGEIILYHPNGKVSAKGDFSTIIKKTFFGEERTREQQGKWLQYNQDGQLIASVFYKDNKMNGAYTSFHKNGNIELILNYEDGTTTGTSKSYFINKQLHRVLQYKKNTIFNVDEFYNIEGTPVKYGSLKDGNGTLDIYDLQTGKISKTYTYENGIPNLIDLKTIATAKGNSIEKTYKNNSGQKIKVVRTLNDKLEGLQEEYNYKGQLKDADYYVEDKKHGTQTRYNDDGTLFWQDTYANNKKIGAFKHTAENSGAEGNSNQNNKATMLEGFYDADQKITGPYTAYLGEDRIIVLSGTYEKNYKTGLWKTFNTNGIVTKETNYFQFDSKKISVKEYAIINNKPVLKSDINYLNNTYDGSFKTYHPNKKTEQTGFYNKGKKEGTWKSYDTAGKLIKETKYNNGTLVD